MTTEAQKAAKARYDAKTAKYYSLKLNATTDAEIIQRLEAMKDGEGIQGYLKRLIREDLKGRNEK